MIANIVISSIAAVFIICLTWEIAYRRGARDERTYLDRTRVHDDDEEQYPYDDSDFWKK